MPLQPPGMGRQRPPLARLPTALPLHPANGTLPPSRAPKDEPHLSSQDSAPPRWFELQVSLSPLSPRHLIFCPVYSVPPTFSCMSTAPSSEPTHQRDATRLGRMKRCRTEWLGPLRLQTSSRPLGSPPHLVPVRLPARLQEPGCGLSPPL